ALMEGAATEQPVTFAGISAKSLTVLLGGDHEGVRTDKVAWKNINRFLEMSIAEQRAVLEDEFLCVFALGDALPDLVARADAREEWLRVSDEEGGADWGKAAEEDEANQTWYKPKKMCRTSVVHLEDEGMAARRPTRRANCQLSQEIGNIYEVKFGFVRSKPAELIRFVRIDWNTVDVVVTGPDSNEVEGVDPSDGMAVQPELLQCLRGPCMGPKLDPDLYLALKKRVACQETPEKRQTAGEMPVQFATQCRGGAQYALLCKSYGLRQTGQEPRGERLISAPASEQTAIETQPNRLETGTRDALLLGNSAYWMNYNAQRRKPTVPIRGWGKLLMTFSNVTDQPLPDKHCFIIASGVALEGPVATWRSPSHAPWDIELRERGGLNGDLDAVSANGQLVAFVAFAQPGADLVARATLEQEVEGGIPKMAQEAFNAVAPRERVREFVSVAQETFTGDVRGRVANMASRAARALFCSGGPLADGTLLKASRLCVLCRAAMGAPKNKSHAQ
ncbi:unnamed protein product, partial [Prorocentrum cordatum]